MLRGFTPQAALDAPRFCISAAVPDAEVKTKDAEGAVQTQDSAGDINSEVYFEDGISEKTVAKLRGMVFQICCYEYLVLTSHKKWVTMPIC